jgi:hypothetical protein
MRNPLLLVLSMLLLGVCWAAAQNYPSQSNSTQTTPTSAGTETTVQGCLSSSNGNYVLIDKNGKTFQLTGDSATLSEHIGHEVKVTGTTTTASSGTGGAMGQTSASDQAIAVTSVKHISKSCKTSGMSH